ncbi:unnamed protein product [Gordionus sp. m RMFG-2023]|uniref:uracil phosphoribosyltransferase homolog n=1 Tax=Gordionus sp. m RMFG-2023 TaxID=3053472 RepID=UPI0030E365E5
MAGIIYESTNSDTLYQYGSNVKLLKVNNSVKELHTIIRDKATPRSDFVFYADRLIRIVVEEGLNHLPYYPLTITTPTGYQYHGLQYQKGSCGVSIMRSGEAMEKGLRDCCQSMRIGKILIQKDDKTNEARVLFARLPEDIQNRKVLLMYPIISSGSKVIQAIQTLKENNVVENNIIVLNLFCTPTSLKMIAQEFPGLLLLTSEIHPVAPTHFGKKYYGTD